MASLNKWIGIGRLGQDPDIRYMTSGKAIANFSIACDEQWKDQNGQKQEKTEWVRIALFGKTAEIAAEYLSKGSQCYIEGRIQTRKWQDKDGQDKYTTEVVGDKLLLLGGKRDDNIQQKTPQAPARQADQPEGKGDFDGFFEDDLPF